MDAALALRDVRLDGHDAEILALQNAGPFATAGDLNTLQLTLQSAIDGILAEISTLGGATNLVNAPAWLGNVTWDLLAGTNQIRNLHATGPLSIALANDDWTLSFGCDAYTTQQTDDAIAAALTDYFTRAEVTVTVVAAIDESKGYTDTQLADYSTSAQMTQAITDALVPYGTAAQRDAAIAAALAAYYTSVQTDAAIAAAIAPYYTSAETDAAIAAAVALSNGQTWNGGPTFNLLRGSNVLRNLSVAGALTASFQNLDDTILIESDSYARSETYTQLETGAAITAAIDALNLSQYRTEAQVLALIAGELVPYWDQTEVSTYVAGELANYATSSSVTSAISSALSSYDNSSQVDSKIITALLDFYTRTEVDQQITNALGNVDLSNYYSSAQTDSLFYPRTELDSLLTATLTQYWTSGRTQTEIDDAVAGLLDQATADTRYFVRAPGAESGNIFNLVQEQFTPRIVRNLLLEAPLQGDTILGNQSTLRLRCDSWTKAEADGRFLRTNDLGPLDARYFPNTPGAEGSGIFNLVQTQFTPVVIRNILCQTPLSCQPILGNGSTLQITCDCWSKGQSDGRYPLIANFNSLGSTVTSIDGRVSTLESDVPAIDGRVTALENSGGVAPTADLTVNSLTATTFVETPQLQSAAGDLQIQNALVTVRKEDGALLASFADGGISLDRDVTVAAASTLNATTADITQLTVGSTAATGAFSSNSSVTANLEVVSNLRVEAPLVRCDPTAPWLSIEGGAQGVLVNDTLLVNGAIAPEASLPYLFLSGGTTGLEMNTKFAAVTGLGDPGGFCELAVINQAPTGVARLFPLHAEQRARGGQGRAGGAGQRRRAAQRPQPEHRPQHHGRHRQSGHRAEHGRKQQRRGDLLLRLPEPLGREAQDERPAALGEGGAGALRRRGGQELRSSRRRRQADGLRGAGGLQVGPAGQELLQAQNLRGPGIDDAGLPADDGGALADLQEPAAEDRETREEEAGVDRARLAKKRGAASRRQSWRRAAPRRFRSFVCLENGGAGGHRAAGAAGPGLQRAGSPQALSDRPAGVPGPAGPDERAGRGGPARRRGQADPGTQAQESGEVGSRGAQRPAAGGPGGLQPEHQRAEQVRLGGPRRLHPGDCHEGPARQAGGNGDGGGRGDHPLARPGRGQLRRHHGSGQRVPGAGGSPARRGGAPTEGPHGPQRDGGRGPGDSGSRRTSRAWLPGGGAAGASTWTRRRRPTTPGRTRR